MDVFGGISEAIGVDILDCIQCVNVTADIGVDPKEIYIRSQDFVNFKQKLKSDGFFTQWAKDLMHYIFDLYDEDKDGKLNKLEMQRLLKCLQGKKKHYAFESDAEVISQCSIIIFYQIQSDFL